MAACALLFTGCAKELPTTATPTPKVVLTVNNNAVTADSAASGSGSPTTYNEDEILPQSPLDILIKQPYDGQTITQKEVLIIGKTAPNATVTANGEITLADDKGNFKIQLVLENGLQVIEIEASNALGDDKIVELSVDVDFE